MKITHITEKSKHWRADEPKPKARKPSRKHQQRHPGQSRGLVGEAKFPTFGNRFVKSIVKKEMQKGDFPEFVEWAMGQKHLRGLSANEFFDNMHTAPIRGQYDLDMQEKRAKFDRESDYDLKNSPFESLEESVGQPITEAEFDRLAEKKDACYHKVKSRYKVWPSAYASGALVQCRKKGAKNWGNG